jgi:hypothetical protein
MERLPIKRKSKVPIGRGVIPKQAKVADRGYEVLTQEGPRGSRGSQLQVPEVCHGSSGWCFVLSSFILLLFCCDCWEVFICSWTAVFYSVVYFIRKLFLFIIGLLLFM